MFFIVVDIFEHGASASKRGPIRSVDISEKDLFQSVESKGQGDGPPVPSSLPVAELDA